MALISARRWIGSERSSASTSWPSRDVTNPWGAKVVPSTRYSLGKLFSITKSCQKRVVRNAEGDKTLGYTNPGDTHLVGGQCPCFVGADYVRTTEGLNTGKIPNDRVLLGHLFGSEGKACGDHGGKAFWDSGDGKRHGNLEVIDSTVDCASMGWIPEVLEVDDPDEDTDDADDFGEHVTKVIQLAFERCLLVYLRRDGLVDITNGRPLAGKDHDSLGIAIHNGSPLCKRK
jgi:hypothetical protein